MHHLIPVLILMLSAAPAAVFEPSYESFSNGYAAPAWFADGKLGLWAHWGPQGQTEAGDWYARLMYNPKVDPKRWEAAAARRIHAFHLSNYGHPSEFGYKEVINTWKADKFEPEALMALYAKAGARYFVSMGNHHDNYDLWNSKHHEWNAVNVGPKKDIVGLWAAAARKQGLKFGVSVHAARAWSWFEPTRQIEEQEGPFKGRKYDGWLTKADGKGKWWEGLDPQNLYLRPHEPGAAPDSLWSNNFLLRTKQLLDDYKPDLFYFDDGDLPLGPTGLEIMAHALNTSAARSGGKPQIVVNIKNPKREASVVLDIERGGSENKRARPWQVDTCIGGWFYTKGTKFKSAEIVLKNFVDIVAKNGNLLLSIPQHGDGTIDESERQTLEGIAAWNAVNGEAIFGSRPFPVFGEGLVNFKGSGIGSGDGMLPYTRADFRYTRKGNDIYAFAMTKPVRVVRLYALAKNSPYAKGTVSSVEWLGHGALPFAAEERFLKVEIPDAPKGGPIWVFRVKGLAPQDGADRNDLLATDADADALEPDGAGLVKLPAERALVGGKGPFLEMKGPGNGPSIGGWNNREASLSWKVRLEKAATFEVRLRAYGPEAEVRFGTADRFVTGTNPGGGLDGMKELALGKLGLEAGISEVKLSPNGKWGYLNFVELNLSPVAR